jgi:hypothetical protein
MRRHGADAVGGNILIGAEGIENGRVPTRKVSRSGRGSESIKSGGIQAWAATFGFPLRLRAVHRHATGRHGGDRGVAEVPPSYSNRPRTARVPGELPHAAVAEPVAPESSTIPKATAVGPCRGPARQRRLTSVRRMTDGFRQRFRTPSFALGRRRRDVEGMPSRWWVAIPGAGFGAWTSARRRPRGRVGPVGSDDEFRFVGVARGRITPAQCRACVLRAEDEPSCGEVIRQPGGGPESSPRSYRTWSASGDRSGAWR